MILTLIRKIYFMFLLIPFIILQIAYLFIMLLNTAAKSVLGRLPYSASHYASETFCSTMKVPYSSPHPSACSLIAEWERQLRLPVAAAIVRAEQRRRHRQSWRVVHVNRRRRLLLLISRVLYARHLKAVSDDRADLGVRDAAKLLHACEVGARKVQLRVHVHVLQHRLELACCI